MSYHYSDPDRETETYSLPDVEVFYMSADEFVDPTPGTWMVDYAEDRDPADLAGWYFWFCFPGCLPEGEPIGPYATETEAIAAAQEY